MPELAEILFATKAWAKGKGRKINKVETKNASRVYRELDPAVLKRTLKGSVLLGSETHGKKNALSFFRRKMARASSRYDRLAFRGGSGLSIGQT